MIKRFFASCALIGAILWLGALPASAHTEYESSNPADGVVLTESVARIEVTFSGEAEPAGEGFVVLDSSGNLREPSTTTTDDNLTWVMVFDPPLPEGTTGVRWSVAAPDAHPISGSFSFAVTPPVTAAVETTTESAVEEAATIDLDAFLDTNSDQLPLSETLGVLARGFSILGAMLAVGGIAFAALVMRGTEQDIRSVLFWVRRAAAILAVGALAELVHQVAVINGNWWTLWPPSSVIEAVGGPFGVSIGLRLLGAALMLRAHLNVIAATDATDHVVKAQVAIGIGGGPKLGVALMDAPTTATSEPYAHEGDMAWHVSGDLKLVGFGVLAALMSYVFDGHTVTAGLWWITGVVDLVHVGAAAVWSGGLVMLVHVVWLRHRSNRDSRALQLAVRFSVVAAGALVVAGAAGVVLAAIILDDVSELWTTPWGRSLIAKVTVVATAAGAGFYNHKVLIPRMMSRPANDPAMDAEFRRAVSWEGATMGLVILLTAYLVGAAS